MEPPPTLPPGGRPRKERIRVREVRQRQLLVGRVGTLPNYPARFQPCYSMRELATTQLPTLNLTPNSKSSFLHTCFPDPRYSTMEKEKRKIFVY